MTKKAATSLKTRTSYHLSLLQARAHRILKQKTTEVLNEFEITTIDWAFLGLLYDNKKGLRLSAVADELGVEAPFVTSLVNKLIKKNVIAYTQDPDDNRAKIIVITEPGTSFVQSTEKVVKERLKLLFKDITTENMSTHTEVLKKIIENCKNMEKKKS